MQPVDLGLFKIWDKKADRSLERFWHGIQAKVMPSIKSHCMGICIKQSITVITDGGGGASFLTDCEIQLNEISEMISKENQRDTTPNCWITQHDIGNLPEN